MAWLLDLFHKVPPHNYGLAIIVLVLIVRVLLHPITKKGQVNMVKMQKQMASLQPKVEELKKKYANDKAKLNQEMMELYREAGISPAGQMLSCLPMALQMPIWIALWTALTYSIEMRHAPFCLWIRDLTGTDAFNRWIGWEFAPFRLPLISGIIGQVDSLNLLPLLLGISMYLQQKLMPRATGTATAGSKPDQLAQQQKIMSFMTVFFTLLFYNAPAGLNLYIMASNLFGTLEQWRIRKHIHEQEQRPAPAPSAVRTTKKPSGFWRRLEKAVEQARQQPSARRKDKHGRR